MPDSAHSEAAQTLSGLDLGGRLDRYGLALALVARSGQLGQALELLGRREIVTTKIGGIT